MAYRDMGYLPQALLNALARLGWSHGDQEKFTREELIEKFSLENVGKSAGVFNAEKLLDLNAWYIRESSDEDLLPQLMPFLHRLGFENPDEDKVKELISILKVRSKTLLEMAEGTRFCLEDEVTYEEKADRKFLKSDIVELFQDLREEISGLSRLTQPNLEKAFTDFLDEKQIKLRKIAQPLRVALTGKTVSPGIFEVMEVLGKDKVIQRMEAAIAHIKGKR
jgi:glutamyl-tRNA synthetase